MASYQTVNSTWSRRGGSGRICKDGGGRWGWRRWGRRGRGQTDRRGLQGGRGSSLGGGGGRLGAGGQTLMYGRGRVLLWPKRGGAM